MQFYGIFYGVDLVSSIGVLVIEFAFHSNRIHVNRPFFLESHRIGSGLVGNLYYGGCDIFRSHL